MRKSKQEKAESRERIVEEATRLFLERGIANTSVAEVMQAADMTHGGFYKHFSSKDDLVRAAIEGAFGKITTRFDARLDASGPAAAATAYVDEYLSPEHIAHPGHGCPVAALATEAWRSGHAFDTAFSEGANDLIDRFATARSGGSASAARAGAISELTRMVGAVVIARAVGSGPLQEEILDAIRGCRG